MALFHLAGEAPAAAAAAALLAPLPPAPPLPAAAGHVHLADMVRYLGVTYACNHAVCGSWWDGPRDEFPPAYAIIDLHSDGTFSNRVVDWGWKA